MAKKRKRRNAGPPPVTGPKRPVAVAAAEAARAKPASGKRRPGEPIPPSFRGVLVRAAVVAALFVPYLIYAVGEKPGPAIVIALVALALMLPLGIWLDRFRYRRQLGRWEERRAGRTPGR